MIEARDRLYQMIGGYRVTQLVHAAASLGVCDAIADGPREPGAVAGELGANPDLLRRLMRALAGVGILEEGEDGRFSNTPIGALLTKIAPGSMRNAALYLPDDPCWRAWAELPRTVRDGAIPFELAHGRTFWDMVKSDSVVADRFNGFMASQTDAFVPQLLGAFDFSKVEHIVDVGGGNGGLVAAILMAHPSARAILFDLEAGLEGADEYLQARGVKDRCELVPGSFFDSVPAGADVYLLRLILHDWQDDRAAQILSTCRRAMRPGARLFVIDHLLPVRAIEGPRERQALLMDMHMHVLYGARERTEEEMIGMLKAAGFKVERVIPTSPTSTVVATAV